jgi:hypothetical protein
VAPDPLTFHVAHAVLGYRDPMPRDPSLGERLVAAVRDEFPNVLNRSLLPPEVPVQTPHIVLASSSSQLAVSAAQADFEVRFYGEYPEDIEKGLGYVERKLLSTLEGLKSIDVAPATLGLIGTFHLSFRERDESAAAHILRTHLRTEVDPNQVQDALARVALKVRDTYFVTLTLGNYESRSFERPLLPGLQHIRIRPWEGRVEDHGLELTLDINNNLEARVKREDPIVSEDGVRAVIQMFREVATSAGPAFAETGQVSTDALTASSQL